MAPGVRRAVCQYARQELNLQLLAPETKGDASQVKTSQKLRRTLLLVALLVALKTRKWRTATPSPASLRA